VSDRLTLLKGVNGISAVLSCVVAGFECKCRRASRSAVGLLRVL
jgi:hypothetical protein